MGIVAVAALVAVVATVVIVRAVAPGDGGADGRDFGPGPLTEPTEEWTVDLDDTGDEVTVLSDGERVYVVAVVEDQEDFTADATVTAYDASDGDLLWSEEVGSSLFGNVLRLLGDQVVLSDDDDATTRLLDAATGDEAWSVDGLPVDGHLTPTLPFPLTPADTDILYVTDEGQEEVTAVERSSGDELWTEDAGDAVVCDDAVATISIGESDPDEFTIPTSEVVVRDPRTGEELWSEDAYPGFCDGDRLALGTDDDEVTVFHARSGEPISVVEIEGGADGFLFAVPFGDFLAVSAFGFSGDGTAAAGIYSLPSGEPTWDEDDAFVYPVGEDRALVASDDDGARLVRAADGEDLGEVVEATDGYGCTGAITGRTVVTCDDDLVLVHDVDHGLDELWSLDVGEDVVEVAVGGDRLFVVADGALTAYR